MSMTVGHLLNTDILRSVTLVAGHAGLDRIVESVNMMDAPDIVEWIRRHQLLVTTLYNVKDHLEVLTRLIPDLIRAGCSGLAVKCRYVPVIPKFMVKQANESAFPLIELPLDVPLGVISHEITRILLSRDEHSDDRATDLERLWDSVMTDTGPEAVAAYLARYWKGPVALYGQDRNLLALSPSGMPQALFHTLLDEVGALWDRTGRLDVHAWTLHGHVVEKLPLIEHRFYYGDVVVIDRIRTVGDVMEVAARAVSAFYLKKYLQHRIWSQHRQRLVRQLIEPEHKEMRGNSSYDECASLAWPCDFLRATTYGVAVGVMESVSSPGRLGNHWHQAHSLQEEVLMRLEQNLGERGWRTLGSVIGGELVLLVAGTSGPEPDIAPQHRLAGDLSGFASKLSDLYAIRMRFALGSFYSSSRHIHDSYHEAQETLKTGTNTPISHYRPHGVKKFLQQMPATERNRFVDTVLGSLLSLPPADRDLMLRTLKTFLDSQNQVTDAAKALFVHRNTVLYRLRKLEELLGRSFDNADDVLAMRLALVFLTESPFEEFLVGSPFSRLADS